MPLPPLTLLLAAAPCLPGGASVEEFWVRTQPADAGAGPDELEPEEPVRFLIGPHRPSLTHTLCSLPDALLCFDLPTTRHLRIQKLHDSQAPPVAKRRGNTKACWQMPEQDLLVDHQTHQLVIDCGWLMDG